MRARARTLLKVGALIFVFLVLVGVGAAAGILAGYLRNAPSVEDVEVRPNLPTTVYDVNGQVISKYMIENRVLVPLRDMPDHLIQAVIAVEDHNFYQHHGISVRRILGALWADIKNLSPDQGGSTITAQLARNVFLSHEKTINRKIWEALYAFQLERRYTKDEILEFYLNYVYFNHGAYGVEAASQVFFGKHVGDLTLGEAALLAGVVNGPEVFSPYKNLEASLRRRKIVLGRMVDVGYITEDQARQAAEEPVRLVGLKPRESVARYFSYMVRDYLLSKYGREMVYSGGLTVRTTLDLSMQRAAERAFASLLPTGRTETRGSTTLTYPQSALVALDADTGEIRALVGGRGEDEYNRAIRAERSPGSCIKPFVYAAAIDSGYTPATVVVDEPIEFPQYDGTVWAPQNYTKTFLGPLTLRQALEQSINVVAIKLTDALTPRKVIDYAKRMGITTLVESGPKNDVVLSLALGGLTRGVTPLELAEAYSSLANLGMKVKPYFILEVRDRNGVLLESGRPQKDIVMDERTAYILTDMMKGVITSPNGTGRRANIGRPAAGKTGTADSNTDAWFVGFTPDLVTAVWIGEDQTREMNYPKIGKIGSSLAAEVWGKFMKDALLGVPPRDFPVPSGIVQGVRVCTESGLLATDLCPPAKVTTEKFIAGTEPVAECDVHKPSPPPPPIPEPPLFPWEEWAEPERSDAAPPLH
ncbi:MAG: penicillin-binding protein 1A [Firmicutes bacterium]|jgi:penicillin-binding protein 1A|nr:penicillin-binding protein 1A [Bacillota bacterium]